jgi:pyruvate dehydrogenase E1 component alpha subunit
MAERAAVPAAPDVRALGGETCLALLTDMLRVRRLEERCAQLYGEQKIRGFLHLAVGEEAIAAGVMPHLRADDNVVATYREHGHALLRGVSMNAIMAEMYGRVEGCSRGRGGSMHLFDRATRFYGGNAIVGGGLALAAGLALADRLMPRDHEETSAARAPVGERLGAAGRAHAVTACFFGEGAVAEGAFHEAMNLAALWQLPVLFICENNLYAMGTALSRSQSRIDLTAKAKAYGMPSANVNGMNVLAVHDAARQAVAQVREHGAPLFLELHTYRFRAHSMFDPELYRDKAEVERWKQHDPIRALTDRLLAAGLAAQADIDRIDRECLREVDAAVAFAEAAHAEPVEQLALHLTAAR